MRKMITSVALTIISLMAIGGLTVSPPVAAQGPGEGEGQPSAISLGYEPGDPVETVEVLMADADTQARVPLFVIPKVLGDFIRTFAESGAAGVIGTEVKVWKPLATFVAERFFDAFLARQPVGQILRGLRHELLRRYNPLGLVYTNYCSADLKLEKTGI